MIDVGWLLIWVQKLEGIEELVNEGEVDEWFLESVCLFYLGRDVCCVVWFGRFFLFIIMYVEELNCWQFIQVYFVWLFNIKGVIL